jgi:hypothetical protein
MAQQIINIGEVANDGTGEKLRDAFLAVNANFGEIYAAGPVGSNIQITNGTITTLDNLDLTLNPSGSANIQLAGAMVPSISGVYSLGRPSRRFDSVHATYYYGNGLGITGVTNINNGNSSVVIAPGGNITVSVAGSTALVISNSVATFDTDIVTSGNITADSFVGNISGNIAVEGTDQGLLYNNSGQVAVADGFAYDPETQSITVTGSVTADTLIGSAAGLTGILAARGPDTNNWNLLLEMGVYTVNRTSWAGTTGTPVNSQIFVGLLEVKQSREGQAVQQTFYPGAVEINNPKLQWNRSYWQGTWTPWVKMLNEQQELFGGEF